MKKQFIAYWKSQGLLLSQGFAAEVNAETWAENIGLKTGSTGFVVEQTPVQRFGSGSLWLERLLDPSFRPSSDNANAFLVILKETTAVAEDLSKRDR